jgi:hypothetical protein
VDHRVEPGVLQHLPSLALQVPHLHQKGHHAALIK